MTHGSLFNGIGGFQLAAEWIGWDNTMSCEIDKFCNRVTKYYFPDCIQHEDIRTTRFAVYNGRIDIITGGFPCQPYSLAGKRKGKEDERHLWPEMLRAIGEIQPRWVVGENVFGLINWNGGLVFDEVQADLEAAGYEVMPFILPACATNAPHRRERVWFIAHSNHTTSRSEGSIREQSDKIKSGNRGASQANRSGNEWSFTNTNSNGLERLNSEHEVDTGERGKYAQRDIVKSFNNGDVANTHSESPQRRMHQDRPEISKCNVSPHDARLNARTDWQNFPTQPPICSGNDGISTKLDGITFPKWRVESIKAGGNAIVPQVAYEIFKTIELYETTFQTAIY